MDLDHMKKLVDEAIEEAECSQRTNAADALFAYVDEVAASTNLELARLDALVAELRAALRTVIDAYDATARHAITSRFVDAEVDSVRKLVTASPRSGDTTGGGERGA